MSCLFGITMGCPVGIGPEIIIRFFQQRTAVPAAVPVVLGDLGVLRRCAATLAADLEIVAWQPGEPVRAGALHVLPLSDLGPELEWGRPDVATGRAMARYIEEAVRLLAAGSLAGMVTCPITKSALNLAGYQYPGHTEMLAALGGAGEYAMMMAGERLRVTLVTIHVGLAQVAGLLTVAKIAALIELTARSLQRDFGIDQPRLAVAGLNPHAGEAGMFGDEEERLIAPALTRARAAGWRVDGVFPPDTVFNRAAAGQYDAVVCMYHDQGLIPFKLLHFEDGVNVTLGLPFVRTSVDHGTAYDIAGQGKASAASLLAAFALAVKIADNRKRFAEKQ
jgi:4-hydroxythreonine-4-phosphate dehydrogenase